jgi:hypothetical protein
MNIGDGTRTVDGTTHFSASFEGELPLQVADTLHQVLFVAQFRPAP